MNEINIKDLISVRQAAQILGLTTARIYQMIEEHKLESLVVGDKILVNRDEVEKLIKVGDKKADNNVNSK
jgi:excisionase family DNA binding protein